MNYTWYFVFKPILARLADRYGMISVRYVWGRHALADGYAACKHEVGFTGFIMVETLRRLLTLPCGL